jgi:hypothetical protein
MVAEDGAPQINRKQLAAALALQVYAARSAAWALLGSRRAHLRDPGASLACAVAEEHSSALIGADDRVQRNAIAGVVGAGSLSAQIRAQRSNAIAASRPPLLWTLCDLCFSPGRAAQLPCASA